MNLAMQVDNQGQAGPCGSERRPYRARGRLHAASIVIGHAGASLPFSECMGTPANSALSAVEALESALPPVTPYIVPLAATLVALFAIQRRGRRGRAVPVRVHRGGVFRRAGPIGPVFSLPFDPGVLSALDPHDALAYVAHASGATSFLVLGSVFLALTDRTALYAGLGPRRP